MGENLATVYVLRQLHKGVKRCAKYRLMHLGTFGHFRLAKFHRALESRLVCLLAGHERAEITDLECLRKILVVIERLEAFGFEVDELQVEALRSGKLVPVHFGDPRRYKT